MRALASAKINLHLRVGRRREDGFHPLLSWMTTIGLFDTLHLQRARGSGIRLVCQPPGLTNDPTQNLVFRAAGLLIERYTRRTERTVGGAKAKSEALRGVSIRLQKRIPVGAGLGGGSSDAARTLLAVNRLLKLNVGEPELAALASELGSDVSFFLHGPSAICEGRGEIVRPVAVARPGAVLLICPPFGCSTPAVYRAFDEMGLGDDTALQNPPNWRKWIKLESEKLLPLLVNDLEPAAFAVRPELGEIRQRLEQQLGRIVRMSGSGSSLFTLYDDLAAADEARSILAAEFDELNIRAVALCPQHSVSRNHRATAGSKFESEVNEEE